MKPLNEYIEHTLLKQDATKEQFLQLFKRNWIKLTQLFMKT